MTLPDMRPRSKPFERRLTRPGGQLSPQSIKHNNRILHEKFILPTSVHQKLRAVCRRCCESAASAILRRRDQRACRGSGTRLAPGTKADSGAAGIWRRKRPISAVVGIARELPGARLVPRREVRHLGTLGTAVPAGDGRLVCATNVSVQQFRLQIPRREIWPPLEVRLQGCDPRIEGREEDRKSTRLNSSHRCISYA